MALSSLVRQNISDPPSSRRFFADLPVAPSFDEAIEGRFDHPLPADWWIVVTDIVNSTIAVSEGRYKDVNTIGGALIMAAINLDRSIEIPYIFGGDGATLAIPQDMEIPMRRALLATKELASKNFALDLRIAMIPVRDLEAKGKKTRVAKYQQSPHMRSAMLIGDGWPSAETWAKSGEFHEQYEVKKHVDLRPEASYEGFECRWQTVPSRRDHKLCLLVGHGKEGQDLDKGVFRQVMSIVHEHYGDLQAFHPLSTADLKLSLNPLRLINEAKIRLSDDRFWSICKYVVKLICLNIVGSFLFRFKVRTKDVDWGVYKPDFIANADFFKFDGTIRMVLDSTEHQSARLEASLEELYSSGKIVFGLHRSEAAILTCLVSSYSGNHAHFVDGNGGGYALAALALKQRRTQSKISRC